MGDARFGFRMAGMMAEIDYLGREKVSGEVHYWREGDELRRKLDLHFKPPQNGKPLVERDVQAENAFCVGVFKQWMECAGRKIVIYINRGRITDIKDTD